MRDMTTPPKRRLTTILCADVYGYSRLMGVDEAGTLEDLRRSRAAMTALVERHDGRVVNTWGDALIAEFPSVVEAVQCAIEVQQELSVHNADRPEAQRMRYRIGINLGDVMVDGSDIYGDGVNIAARLQELAEPGGILISGPVYDQVHNKLSIGFDCLGQQQVKNVAAPVMSYRIALGGRAAPVPHAADERSSERATMRRDMAAMSATAPPTGIPIVDWYASLPRHSAILFAVCLLLFLINAFTGFRTVWFHWPVTPMLLVAIAGAIRGRRAPGPMT
jgi:adenylate cyclase